MINLLFFFLIILKFSLLDGKDFPKIYGCVCEGGLLIGKVSQSDIVKVDGKKQIIFKNGEFIFAFGRKFKDKVFIEINNLKRELSVEKKEYKIERISGLPGRKVEPSKDDLIKIKKDQKIINKSKLTGIKERLFKEKFILPAKGRISGIFGSQRILNSKPRRPHYGIDIAAIRGTKLVSPNNGNVKVVKRGMFFTGNTIIIDHGLGLISIFAHLDDILVNEGDTIERGQQIGTIGMTGRATGPHVHWGVYLNDTPVDPAILTDYNWF